MSGTSILRPASRHQVAKPLTPRQTRQDVGLRTFVMVLSPLRILCDALHAAFSTEPGVTVVSSRASVFEIAKLCKASPETIVIADGSSTDALRLLGSSSRRLAHCRIVVFGLRRRREYNRLCSKVRARGLLAHGARLPDLIEAIRSVQQFGFLPSSFVVENANSRRSGTVGLSAIRALTRREREIADTLETGLSNAGIARKLGISAHTVKVHVGHILTKLHVHDRAEVGSALDRLDRLAARPRRQLRNSSHAFGNPHR